MSSATLQEELEILRVQARFACEERDHWNWRVQQLAAEIQSLQTRMRPVIEAELRENFREAQVEYSGFDNGAIKWGSP